MSDPIKVTATDPVTGESQTQEIDDSYCIVVAGTAYIANRQIHANGTHVITIKGIRNPMGDIR